MYSNENAETFPKDSTTCMEDLNKLYPDYVAERRVFMCTSDNLVDSDTNAGITSGGTFNKDECSYGYDNTHSPSDDPGTAIIADRPTNTAANAPTAATNSPNHGGTTSDYSTADVAGNGQNVGYIDGHVEFVKSANAGYLPSGGTRDDIYDGTGSGTDSYILQDGA
jgi:prepilin-type processing-associated H-X9-DG protein